MMPASIINKNAMILNRFHLHRHLHGTSAAGGRNSFLSRITTEDRAELQAFNHEVRQAIREGTFNAAELAEKAPAALKTWNEENGINIEEALTPTLQKPEGFRVKASEGEVVPRYRGTSNPQQRRI